jgi:O-6-methylguanine DNA methyltransferase
MSAPDGRRQSTTIFGSRVLAAVRRVPAGRVATYGDIAAAAGRPRAARAVGNIMRKCADPSVPCHRVVGAGAMLGGFGRDLNRKRLLLRGEGIVVVGNRIRNFEDIRVGRRRSG